ncbi:MAG: hypothetical protein AB7J32_02535 [Pseudonocardia sp.]
MGGPNESRARRLWRALEGVHAVVYFAPESVAGCEALGTRGYWSSYFALRAAPLGPVGARAVAALFYNFHPGLVARSVPAVWTLAAPARYLEVRLEAVDAALRRLLGDELVASAELAEAAELARAAAEAVPTAGRALAAANAELPWPAQPHLVLWHAQTVLREHRGDGHVAALLTAGLEPAEALVLFAADVELDPERLAKVRGWSAAEWAAARGRLIARGLVEDAEGGAADDADGAADGAAVGSAAGSAAGSAVCRPTAAGRALRASVEATTDALADVAWQAIGDAAAQRLLDLSGPFVRAIMDGGGVAADNPMGLRPLISTAERGS